MMGQDELGPALLDRRVLGASGALLGRAGTAETSLLLRQLTLRLDDGAAVRAWPAVSQGLAGLGLLRYAGGSLPAAAVGQLAETDLLTASAWARLGEGTIAAIAPEGVYQVPLVPRSPPEPSGDPVLDDHFFGPESWDAWLNLPKDPAPVFWLQTLRLTLSNEGRLVLRGGGTPGTSAIASPTILAGFEGPAP